MMSAHGKSLAARVSKAKTLVGSDAKAVSLMEAAGLLRIGRSSMQRLVREGQVKSFKIGRSLRITVRTLDEYIAKQER